jgi:dimethylhistidine N-methyltransferase
MSIIPIPQQPSEHPPDRLIQTYRKNDSEVRAELSAGLLELHAIISPKYLYDELGSRLFAAICELPEYYPTRTEASIFQAYRSEIARSVGPGATLIDLGAGNCAKAASLFPALRPAQYVPVDISVEFLRDAVEQLRRRYPQVDMVGVGLDFSEALDLPSVVKRDKRLFFYPGSSIGNFTPDKAAVFLQRLHSACQTGPDGGLLIGIDLVKDRSILEAAYDDALGVTAGFNLNLLLHLNRLLHANFHVPDWRHRSFYNSEHSRVEMHLEARSNLDVRWQRGHRRFEKGESIHTENSYKYTQSGCIDLLRRAGFETVGAWTDARKWFMVCHARAVTRRLP